MNNDKIMILKVKAITDTAPAGKYVTGKRRWYRPYKVKQCKV